MAIKRIPGWFGDARPGGMRGAPGRQGARLWGVLGAYIAVGVLSAGTAIALGRDPLSCEGWLGARGPASLLLSVGFGVCLGALTVGATRAIVSRAEWGRALHASLRPAVHGASDQALWALALA